MSGKFCFRHGPDLTLSTSSGLHLSKFEKRPKMPPLMALGRIFVARRFAICGIILFLIVRFLSF